MGNIKQSEVKAARRHWLLDQKGAKVEVGQPRPARQTSISLPKLTQNSFVKG